MPLENKLKDKNNKNQTNIDSNQTSGKLRLNTTKGMSTFLAKFINKTLPINEKMMTDLEKNLKKYTNFFAEVLLGKTELQQETPWFKEGVIDVYVKERLSIDEPESIKVLQGALMRLFLDVFQLVRDKTQKQYTTKQWQDGINSIIKNYANAFLGIPNVL